MSLTPVPYIFESKSTIMNRLIIFILIAAFFAGCSSNLDEERKAIASLSEEWDETEAKVDSFSQTLNTEISNWNAMYRDMNITDTSVVALPAETTQKLASLKEECQKQGQVFSQLKSTFNNFRSEWAENTSEVNSLVESAESGDLEPDTKVQIENLEQVASNTDSQVEQWFDQLEEAKKNCEQASNQYAELLGRDHDNENEH
jgi:chromosome segregation ATPase